MSTYVKAERGLARRLVDLRVVCTREWLQECIAVLLMFGDVVPSANENGLIKNLGLTVRLWIIPYCS